MALSPHPLQVKLNGGGLIVARNVFIAALQSHFVIWAGYLIICLVGGSIALITLPLKPPTPHTQLKETT